MNPLVKLVKLDVLPSIVARILSLYIHLLQVLVFELIHKKLRLVEYLADDAYFEEVLLSLFGWHSQVEFDCLGRFLRILLIFVVVIQAYFNDVLTYDHLVNGNLV